MTPPFDDVDASTPTYHPIKGGWNAAFWGNDPGVTRPDDGGEISVWPSRGRLPHGGRGVWISNREQGRRANATLGDDAVPWQEIAPSTFHRDQGLGYKDATEAGSGGGKFASIPRGLILAPASVGEISPLWGLQRAGGFGTVFPSFPFAKIPADVLALDFPLELADASVDSLDVERELSAAELDLFVAPPWSRVYVGRVADGANLWMVFLLSGTANLRRTPFVSLGGTTWTQVFDDGQNSDLAGGANTGEFAAADGLHVVVESYDADGSCQLWVDGTHVVVDGTIPGFGDYAYAGMTGPMLISNFLDGETPGTNPVYFAAFRNSSIAQAEVDQLTDFFDRYAGGLA